MKIGAAYDASRYSIRLMQDDGSEEVIARDDRAEVARVLFELMRTQHPSRVVVLRDGDREVDRSGD